MPWYNDIIMQNSRTTDDITYADLGPNTAARAAHLTLLHDDRVQYEEIQHDATAEAPICGPQTSSLILGTYLLCMINHTVTVTVILS